MKQTEAGSRSSNFSQSRMRTSGKKLPLQGVSALPCISLRTPHSETGLKPVISKRPSGISTRSTSRNT